MHVAVTGASGFIGSELVRALRARGDRVLQIGRSRAQGPDAAQWDPASGVLDPAALEGVDAVVHLAGESIGERKWTPEQKQRILRSRTDGTRLLVQTLAGLRRRPSTLVSASGVDYYGDRGDEIITEASGPGAGFLAQVCLEWEAATEPAAEAGIRVVRMRTGVVLSPAGGALARMLLPFKLGLGGRIGHGDQYMSWISLPDDIAVIVHLLDSELVGPVNVTAPHPVTNRELTSSLGSVLRRPTVIPTPLLPLRLRYGAELVRTLLLEGQRVVPTRLDQEFAFAHPTIEAALRNVLGRASTGTAAGDR